ncbi:MAG: hypothetical protein IPM54_00620 [Polyangiaceae bacterium]|nr:hypothetical protein [Polyangiaceae bacterium]
MKSARARIALEVADDERTVVTAVQENSPTSFIRSRRSRAEWLVDVMLAIPRAIVRVFDRMRLDAGAWLDPPSLCGMLPPPPASRTGAGALNREQFGELVLHNLFRLSPRYAAAAVQVAKVAAIVSKYPKSERIAVFVHFTLSRIASIESNPIPVSWLRTRMSDVGRSELNRALEELEDDGFVRLLSVDTDDAKVVIDGISDVVRGRLTHVELIRPL